MGPSSPLLTDRKPTEIVRTQNASDTQAPKLVKCVLVGDGQVGKTSLVISYTKNGFPSEYIPTAFDKYHVVVMVDNQPVSVQLCDTAGQDDFDPIRTLCYPDTDVFLLCFSVVNPASFQNIRRKWVPEIRRHWPEAVMLLIGTQADRRADVRIINQLAGNNEMPVTEKQARSLAVCIGAKGYVETSALTQRYLKDAFDTAITHALARRRLLNNRRFEKLEARRRWRRLLCCISPHRD